MLPLADLFVHVDVLVDDAIQHGAVPIPPRPGPIAACTDSELRTLALVRVPARRPSQRAWLAEVRGDWAHLVPRLPAQREDHRRVRWWWGAFQLRRQQPAGQLPCDAWQQLDTSALPGKHPRRVRGPTAARARKDGAPGSAGTPRSASGSTGSA